MLKFQIHDTTVTFIGDPHFGKKFSDVPLHRKGEREQMQLDTLKAQLAEPSDIKIMVGDLFDTYNVSNDVLLDVFLAFKEAAEDQPKSSFLLMSGNHDISRDAEATHSFDILEKMLSKFSQIFVFKKITPYIETSTTKGDISILLCPYSAFSSAMAETEPYKNKHFDLVVGHWDMVSFGDDHNVIPIHNIATMDSPLVVTGHEHTADDFFVLPTISGYAKTHHGAYGAIRIVKTGSMMPYSHGEDPTGEIYVTQTLEQIAARLEEDPAYYHNKAVRIVLAPGEQQPEVLDCLQLSIKRIQLDDAESLEVKMDDDFSFKSIFDETFKENDVSDEETKRIWGMYKQEAADAQEA